MRGRGYLVMAVLAVALFAAAAPLSAANITIYDKEKGGTNSWYNTEAEDQEVEYNCITGQSWDLEAFVLTNGRTLSMVGGYNFLTNEAHARSGDIFIDITGDVKYGSMITGYTTDGSPVVANAFGYDYVLDMDWNSRTFNLYDITSTSSLVKVYYGQNNGSNPWAYASGGTLVGTYGFDYQQSKTDAQVLSLLGVSLQGGSHNIVTVDLGFLPSGMFTSHYTMECGNDNLMGQGTKVPEPGTLLLLGLGLIGGALLRKRFS